MKRNFWLTRLQSEEKNATYLDEWCVYGKSCSSEGEIIHVDYDEDIFKHTQYYYEELLSILANYLNMYHSETNSVRYWRILLGTWLNEFVDCTFYRYSHIRKALDWTKDTYLVHILNEKDKVIPFDSASFRELLFNDFYTLQISSDIIRHFPVELYEENPGGRQLSLLYKMSLKPLQNLYGEKLEAYKFRDGNSINVIKSFNVIEPKKKQNGVMLTAVQVKYPTYFRAGVSGSNSSRIPLITVEPDNYDEYMHIVCSFIVQYIPSIYLENYKEMITVVKEYMADPIAYFINEDWHYNEFLKFVAAKTVGDKGKIVALNPGGICGVTRFCREEEHETKLSDYVWTREQTTKASHCIPVERKYSNSEVVDTLLFLSAGFYRPYTSSFDDFPVTYNQIEKYFQMQQEFLDLLSDERKQLLTYRFHPYRHSKEDINRMKKYSFKMALEGAVDDYIEKAELIVIDHITTAIFSVLQYQKKFLLFWDPNIYRVTDEFAVILEELKEQGLFFVRGDEAAEYLNEITDFQSWWETENRQKAITKFASFLITFAENKPSIDDILEYI